MGCSSHGNSPSGGNEAVGAFGAKGLQLRAEQNVKTRVSADVFSRGSIIGVLGNCQR